MTINYFINRLLIVAAFLALALPDDAAARTSDILPVQDDSTGADAVCVNGFTIISSITVTGNKKTKEKIILREVCFQAGDTIDAVLLPDYFVKSQNNLLKTSLFNYVTITPDYSVDGYTAVNINVEERWYFWPMVNITPHNGNLNQWLRNPDLDKVDYCFGASKYNFRGRRESLVFNFRRGFNNVSQIGFADIAVDRQYRHLLALYATFQAQKDVILRTKDDKPEYHSFDETAFYEKKLELLYTFRQDINKSHILHFDYRKISICDSLAMINPAYLGNGLTSAKNFTISYIYKVDNRSSSYYPLTGAFYEFKVQETGLFCHSQAVFGFTADVRQYYNPCGRFYCAGQAVVSEFTNNVPFYMRPSIGAKPNIIEGYEHNLVYGNGIAYMKTSYKFELIPTRVIHVRRINVPKFNKIHFAAYLNVFANCAFVEENSYTDSLQNSLDNTFLGAIGVGLDLVTYYDKAFSVYATRNIQNEYYIGVGFRSFF